MTFLNSILNNSKEHNDPFKHWEYNDALTDGAIEEIIKALKTKTLYLKLKSFRIEKEVSQYVFWFDVKKNDINNFIKITENLKKEQGNISIHVYSRTGIYE